LAMPASKPPEQRSRPRKAHAMQHIVVATDLTAAAEPAIERAAVLCRAMHANLRLLHVLPELLPGVLATRRRIKAQRMLFERAQRLERETGRRVSYNIVHGNTPRWIVRESENLGAVLTVIGHRTDKPPRRLLACTAVRSLHEACNSVLVVRDRSRCSEPYRRALLALDEVTGAEALIPFLRYLAPEATLHRYEIPQPARSPRANGAAEHVRAMRRALGADLLAVGVPRDDTPNPFRFSRILKPLAQAPECDTLIVPQDCAVVPEMPAPARIRAAS